ncbi:RHS repeat-associated protein [Paraburkholderia sp. BL6665CI2N2]|uniref:RHS repeat-associated core domain-containing protein n=1 Tax=Paraburkholderia sp. BL6665CI2N2 TaxID=1938806 RepID=UPI001065267D|nr:RHS repeat-associated core domain-containing protein [Paraburkholderia sp. BL6665CI2N2]TDY25560.1 RHS repeat-associated protein [Paraburkholderia sp. BL6665CI2N2]
MVLGVEPCEVTFEYDALGRLLAETVDGQRSESRHDALGNVTERRLPLGQRISMLHYGSGHVHQISLDGETLSDIERDALHREVQRTQGPRVCRTTYDPRGRTVSRLSERSGREGMADNDLLGSAYQYDLAGNLHQVIGQGGGAHSRGTVHYSYDVMGRMTGYHDGNGLNESYLYDAADNLIDATRDSAASRILDDLLSRFRQTGYSYDGFGQLKRRVRDGLVQDFVHDDEGRMVRASGQGRHGWHSTAYRYDAIGRRTGKLTRRAAADGTALVEETRFVWEGMRMVQVLRDETVRTYVYSPDSPYRPMARVDQPVVSVDGQCRAGGRRVVWHQHAHDNGQVYDVTGANGEVVWEPGFTGFGEYRGTEWLDDRPFDEALRFAGQYADEETGLHYNTFRYYDPATGRFVSQDPIGLAGGFNLYAYAPNPVSWIDPWGLSCETIDPRTESFESWVARSRGEADVYLRSKGTGSVDYVGISKNSTERYAAGLGYKLRLLTEDTGQLLRNQARAVEQAIIDAKRGVFENIDNSIDPGRALYKDAVSWGQNWLKDNGWGRLLE